MPYLAESHAGTGVAAGTAVVLNQPNGLLSGHGMLAGIAARSANLAALTITPPAGWSLVLTQDLQTTGRLFVYAKVAGGSEPTTYTWTLGESNVHEGAILLFEDMDVAALVNASQSATGTAATAHASPAVTPTVDEATIVRFAMSIRTAAGTYTWPTGSIEKMDASANDGTNWTVLSAATQQRVIAGSSATVNATASASSAYATASVALAPATTKPAFIGNNVRAGGGQATLAPAVSRATKIPVPSSGQVTYADVSMDCAGGASAGTTTNMKVLLYADNGSGAPGALLAASTPEVITVVAAGQPMWTRFFFPTTVNVTAGLVFAVPVVDTDLVVRIRYADGVSGDSHNATANYASNPDPFGTATAQAFAYGIRLRLITGPAAPRALIGRKGFVPAGSQSLHAVNIITSTPMPAVTPAAGTIDRVDVFLGGLGTLGQAQAMRAIIYADSGSNTPTGAPLATSDEVTVPANAVVEWWGFTFSSPLHVAAGTQLHLAVEGGATTNVIALQWNSAAGVTGDGRTVTATYANPAATYPGGSTANTRAYPMRASFIPDLTPAVLTAPTIAPTTGLVVGSTLTRTSGTYLGAPTPSISGGKWQRDGVDIAGATNATYDLVTADLGHAITYVETATNSVGSVSSTSNTATVAAVSGGVMMLGIG